MDYRSNRRAVRAVVATGATALASAMLVWAAIKREALAVVAGGVTTPAEFDEMFTINTGAKAGVFRIMDQVGLDVVLDIENHYAAENPHLPEGLRALLHDYVDAGHLGIKTGRGFYAYE